MPSLAEMAVEVLTTADGRTKTALGREHARAWFAARAANAPSLIRHKISASSPTNRLVFWDE